MPTAKINNINCYYEIHGEGTPLVLVAGLASDSQSWYPVLKGLAEHFKVIIFDNRGIGRTEYPKENFQVSTLADDLACLLDRLAIEKADILGHSMGGCIAQELAIGYPGRVDRLILVNTCAYLSRNNRSIFAGLLKILASGKDYELFIRSFLGLIFTSDYLSNKENVEQAVRDALNHPFLVTQEGFRLQLGALDKFDSRDRLKKINAKTLLVTGGRDALITKTQARILSDNMPFASALYIEDAAHSFHIERPDIFISSIFDYLKPRI